MNKTQYKLAGQPEYARPLQEVMVLFHLEPAGTLFCDRDHFSHLTSNQVGVQVEERLEENLLHIETKIWYYDNEGQLLFAQIAQQADINDSREKVAHRLIRLNVWELMQGITGYYPGPWGILRGVRPVKLVHRMLDEGIDTASIPSTITNRYGVASSKARLITNIAIKQRPFLALPGQMNKLVSVYIAIPFCPTRCIYCSFPGYRLPRDRVQIESFLKTLYADMVDAREAIERHGLIVQNIYVGGGTPTSLCEEDFSWLIETISDLFTCPETKEFTVEAGRPDSLNAGKISIINQLGVSRVSVNPQTMQPDTLRHIGRMHTVQDILDVFYQFRKNRLLSINMDIIAGLPGEKEQDMIDTMEKIASLAPDNLTVHTLALKRGAELRRASGVFDLPGEEITRAMVEIAADYAAQMKLEPYYLYRQKYMTGNLENVGYALPGQECFYNIQIMEERQTIIGIGLASTTKAVNLHTLCLQSCYNPKDLKRYMSHLPIYLTTRNRLLEELYGTRR